MNNFEDLELKTLHNWNLYKQIINYNLKTDYPYLYMRVKSGSLWCILDYTTEITDWKVGNIIWFEPD